MKQLFYIFILLLGFTSCEDVIDVDVPNGEPRLVVDASFEVYLNEVPVTVKNSIQLSLSAPFFGNTIPKVNDATVFITDLSDGTIINYTETNGTGFYIPSSTFLPEFNVDYELTIIYNSETYKATTQMFASVPIDNIEQGDGTLFEGDETEIIVSFTDDGARDDFYLFNFDFDLLEVSEDRFYQGESFNFSYFYEDVTAGQNITIKILGIDKRFFNYAGLLIDQSDPDGGGPFATPPALLRGNVINTTNSDNYALGYFNLSEANQLDFTIQEK
ncbi:DUF4249 domain-containing protein [Aquimarina sp. AD10]|nr:MULTISPECIES: DUF4249 family protein [Aquimarina]AXT63774.1 DUF4249 domain-containing protein [Aquimarina sp. AD10]RKM91614.1 DUF4249 domain-containing protein [Aquimarina sp. AD10]